MTISSKNPIQGFVPCQHCGKPAPTHYPKGGPRKAKLYYNCTEHKNQQGVGVAQYCEEHQVESLVQFATKFDAVEECEALQGELENAGLLPTEADIVEPDKTVETELEAALSTDDNEELLIDNDTQEVIEDTPPKRETSNGALLVFLVVLVVLALGAGALLVKRLATKKAAVSSVNKPTQSEPTPQPSETPPPQGVLL